MDRIYYNEKFIDKYITPVRKIASKVPEVVSIEVTTRCQLDCIYCTRDKNSFRDLSLEKLYKLSEGLEGVKKLIICGIGESFCFPEIYEAIWSLKDFKISIITNGAVPIDFKKLNLKRNVELLVFSVDATTEDMMKEICHGYNFEVLQNNLAELSKCPNIAGIINTTITELNMDEIPLLVDFAAEHGLLAVNFELPIGNEAFVAINKEKINSKIKEAVKKAKERNIGFNQFYRLTCNTGGSIVPNIQIDGDFYSCCNGMNIGKRLGNIYENDFKQLWKERAEPLITGNEFCFECKLSRNLSMVLS